MNAYTAQLSKDAIARGEEPVVAHVPKKRAKKDASEKANTSMLGEMATMDTKDKAAKKDKVSSRISSFALSLFYFCAGAAR